MFDIRIENVPFARAGSYMTFSVLPPEWGHKGLMLRTMHKNMHHETFRIIMLHDGRDLDYSVSATPVLVTLRAKNGPGKIEICLPEKDSARIRTEGGIAVRLESVAKGKSIYGFPVGEGVVNVNCRANRIQYRFIRLKGGMHFEEKVHIGDHQRGKKDTRKKLEPEALTAEFSPDSDGCAEFCIYEYMMSPEKLESSDKSFEECLAAAEKHWDRWISRTPEVPEQYSEAARHAMHVNYSATVGKWGNFKRDVMLMSRNWMTNCWSWDHCFNAIACSYADPDAAWDQLNVHFDLQEPGGCLPDGVSAENVGWNFCKPPIHGWALSKMMKNPDLLTRDRLEDFYPKLAKWTEWWFANRDNDKDGLPEYHHGNDSGWDNGTVFDKGFPLCGADLQAFLVLQMDLLAELADKMGRNKEAVSWKDRADAHIELMIEKLWDGEQFHGKKAFTYDYVTQGDCLLNHMPIVLGDRLPADIAAKITDFLKPDGKFLTKYGLATESIQSDKYLESGYWRGPVWGPEIVLIADGLYRAGKKELAAEIARRYCDMCAESLTFAENFDPLSGKPLCDKAYTWGSSAFLILAHDFLPFFKNETTSL